MGSRETSLSAETSLFMWVPILIYKISMSISIRYRFQVHLMHAYGDKDEDKTGLFFSNDEARILAMDSKAARFFSKQDRNETASFNLR